MQKIKLSHFEITNYRSCLKTSIDIEENLMCLIGVNGVGKTNILSGIQFLKKMKGGSRLLFDQNRGQLGTQTKITSVFSYGNKKISLKCDIRYETNDRNYDEVLDTMLVFNLSEITDNKKTITFPAEALQFFELKDHFDVKSGILNHFFSGYTPSEKEIDIMIEVKKFITRVSYYSASQFSDPTKCPISFELEENKPFRHGKQNTFHESFLNDLYLTYKNNKKLFAKFLNTVNKEGIGIVDDISFSEYDMPSSSYEVKSGGKIRKIERNRQLIIPSIEIDSNQLFPNQLSEGTFKTLALVFYIITDNNDLLLIEEPEVCVHHGLLNSIISLIISQSSRKQIIISTHSDFVLDRLEPSNLLIVKKMPNSGTIAKTLNKTLSRNSYKALKSYLSETGNLGEYWKEGGFEDE